MGSGSCKTESSVFNRRLAMVERKLRYLKTSKIPVSPVNAIPKIAFLTDSLWQESIQSAIPQFQIIDAIIIMTNRGSPHA